MADLRQELGTPGLIPLVYERRPAEIRGFVVRKSEAQVNTYSRDYLFYNYIKRHFKIRT